MSIRQVARMSQRIGQTYSDLGRHDEAIAAFTEAIELSPDDAAVYEHRGHAYRAKYHGGDRNPEDLDRAIEDFSRARDLYRDMPPF